MIELLFNLIKIAIGVRHDISKPVSADEWKILYDMAQKQAILGVCFYGVQDLRKKESISVQFLPEPLFAKWLGKVVQIQQRNEAIDKLSAKACKRLEDAGLNAAILKGQGLSTIKRMSYHGMHLLSHYPSEVLWTPIWLVYHKIWKTIKIKKSKHILNKEILCTNIFLNDSLIFGLRL